MLRVTVFVSIVGIIGCAVPDDDVHSVLSALADDGCDHPADGVAICPDEDGGETVTLDGADAHHYVIDVLLPAQIAKAASTTEQLSLQSLRDALAKRLDVMPPPVAVSPDSGPHLSANATIHGYLITAWAHADGPNQCNSAALSYGRDSWGTLFADQEGGWGAATVWDQEWADPPGPCSAWAASAWCQYSRYKPAHSANCL